MHTISIENFQDWRQAARELINNDVKPSNVHWLNKNLHQESLFPRSLNIDIKKSSHKNIYVSKNFIKLARLASYHCSDDQWSLLYECLYRMIHNEKNLLSLVNDPLIKKLMLMCRSINRDAHKMKAFVRFKKIFDAKDSNEKYVAFYRPEHRCLRLVVNFFKRRFISMNLAIITPDESVQWNGHELIFYRGSEENITSAIEDESEQLWLTFYRAIFNPARVKVKAMCNEMPRKYWSTLPEVEVIQELLHNAPNRVSKMLKEDR